MSGSGLTLEERMLARSLQQMMSERRAMQQSRWRFWERWWYDWTMDEAYDSKVRRRGAAAMLCLHCRR
jgi:hypothetical protein